MSRREPPWYRREPYPTVLRVLMDHGLLAEGGTASSLRLAARVASAEDGAPRWGDPVDLTADAVIAEQLTGDRSTAMEVAQDVVDALIEWQAPRSDPAALDADTDTTTEET